MREPRVYRIKKGWKIAFPLMLLALFCVFPLALWQSSWDNPEEKFIWFAAILCVELVLLIWFIKAGFNHEILLDDEGIEAPFGVLNKKRFIQWDEIESYEIFTQNGLSSIRFTLLSGKVRTLGNYNIYESSDTLLAELIYRYTEKQEMEEVQTLERLLEDETLGESEEERIQKLQQYKKICKVVNTTGGISAALYLFWPEYYELQFWTCFLITLVAFCLVIFTKSKISPLGVDNEYIPSVFTSVFFIPLAMLVRVLMDLNFLSFPMELFWVLIPSFLIAALIARFSSEKGEQLLGLGYIMLCCICWLSSSVCTINYFTAENPETKTGYTRSVLKKEQNTPTKGPTTYHFYVAQIENSDNPLMLDVRSDIYSSLEEKDSLIVWVNTGIFNIPVVTEFTLWE